MLKFETIRLIFAQRWSQPIAACVKSQANLLYQLAILFRNTQFEIFGPKFPTPRVISLQLILLLFQKLASFPTVVIKPYLFPFGILLS